VRSKLVYISNAIPVNKFEYPTALLIYLFLALFILRGVLISPGTIGFFHDWVIPAPYPEMNAFFGKNGLYVWDTQIGNKDIPADWIFRIVIIPFSFLDGEILTKGFLILIITISGFGMFCLCKWLKLGFFSSLCAGIIYIFSPILYTRIIAGHLYWLVGYFLTPLILFSFLKGGREQRKKYFIVCGILICFTGPQVQFLIMIPFILLIFSLIDIKNIKKNIIGLSIVLSFVFLIHLSPIIFSQILFQGSITVPYELSQLTSSPTVTISSTLIDSFRLLGWNTVGLPYSYTNLGTLRDSLADNEGIMPAWIFYLDFLLPVTGFSAILLRKDRYTIGFAIISVIGLFIMKGLNPPFSNISSALFGSFLFIFRDFWHTSLLYGFSLTVLAAFFIEKIRVGINIKLAKNIVVPIIVPIILVALIVLSNGYPLLLGNFAGYLQMYAFPAEYKTLYKNTSFNSTYNTFVLPMFQPIKYDNLKLVGLDPLVLFWPNHIFPHYVTYGYPQFPSSDIAIWLLSAMRENNTENFGQLMTGLGVKNIVLRKDFNSAFINYTYPQGADREIRDKWQNILSNHDYMESFLDSQNDLTVQSENTRYKIYQVIDNSNKIFIPLDVNIGGLTDFNELILISNITSLSNVSLYPAISGKEKMIFVDTIKERNMPIEDFIQAGGYTNTADANKGWTNIKNWFAYDHLFASRIQRGAFTTSDGAEFSMSLPLKYQNTPIEIWLKALSWNKGGNITTHVNGQSSLYSLFSTDQRFNLFKIYDGKIDSSSGTTPRILIKNINGGNYVEGIYVKDKSDKKDKEGHENKIFLTGVENKESTTNNSVLNPDFQLGDEQSGIPLYWYDPFRHCGSVFICKSNTSTGWNDSTSFEVSSSVSSRKIANMWSWINGKEIDVNPDERYEIITHMKLNGFVNQSHIVIEGFRESSNNWYQIAHCPTGTSGPTGWHMYSCEITIPKGTTKIRPLLNAGLSFQENRAAVTLFDNIQLVKHSKDIPLPSQEISQILQSLLNVSQHGNSPSVTNYKEINPTLWTAHVNASKPFTLGLAVPHDPEWEARIYKDGKKINTVKSFPLYGSLNAFKIDDIGDLDIVIRYARQEGFEAGLVISGITITFGIFYIFYRPIMDLTDRSKKTLGRVLRKSKQVA
jgi:hypothetical protein